MLPPSHLKSARMAQAILQHVAHRAGEDTDSRDGWCRWSTSDAWPWEWDDYKPLVDRGWLERGETFKDVLLRLTPAGWTLLAAPGVVEDESRCDVRGQNVDGEILP